MLSIVIPVLDAGKELEALLQTLIPARAEGLVGEVIVVDGGSKDDTRQIAANYGARLFYARPGRGTQLRAGGEEAVGKWLLFLHADTRLPPIWSAAVEKFMETGDGQKAGVFKFALDDKSPWARLIERGVQLRWRLFALPYGDQGLLISRKLYDEVGGYDPIPLMEDVAIIRKLGRKRLALLPARALTSAKRYRSTGFLLRPVKNMILLLAYFCGAKPETLAKLYR